MFVLLTFVLSIIILLRKWRPTFGREASNHTTQSLKFCILYLALFSSSASFSFPYSSLFISPFFPRFFSVWDHILSIFDISLINIGYSSQRLEQPRSAIGSWSIRQDYSDTQNLSETASVSKISIKGNQDIIFSFLWRFRWDQSNYSFVRPTSIQF